MSFSRFMSKVYFRKVGYVDAFSGDVSTSHPASSYELAVIVSEGVAFGPADVIDGKVQAFGEQASALRNAGFTVVDSIG